MKKVLAVIVTCGFLFAGLLVTPYAFAQVAGQTAVEKTGTTSGASTPVPARQKAERHERRERHPQIHNALRELRAAKQDLQKAAHDFGGHKAAAIQAINQAISELEAALRYDKK